MDKRSRKMIEFRQQLGVTAKEGHCSDFGRYLAREKPDKLKYLQRMNPDVPVLLSLFGQYIKTLEARGVAGRIEAARRKFSKQNLKKILTQGDPKEVFRLGRVFRDGGAGEPNPKLALLFFLTAAKKGYPPAQNYLGFLHQKGKGVPQDPREAVRWYRRSAGQGFAIAQINLGIMYVQGRGVQRDRAEAYFWLVLAERRSRGKIKAKAGDLRFAIERSLLPEQVKAARVRADKWRPRPVRRQLPRQGKGTRVER
jgi:TPR repeat protein